MKLLLTNGSLRKGDGLPAAASLAAEKLDREGLETQLFQPVKTEDLPCSGCGACKGAGMCVADPRAGEFLRAAQDCGAFLFLAPAGLLGPDIGIKNFLERIAQLAARRKDSPLAGKPAAALLVVRRGEGSGAAKQLRELLRAAGFRLRGADAVRVCRAGDPGIPEALAALAAALGEEG